MDRGYIIFAMKMYNALMQKISASYNGYNDVQVGETYNPNVFRKIVNSVLHVRKPFSKQIILSRHFVRNMVNTIGVDFLLNGLFIGKTDTRFSRAEFQELLHWHFPFVSKNTIPVDLNTADGMVWLFTCSIGFLLLQKSETGLFADLTFLSRYQTKPGLAPLDVRIDFVWQDNQLVVEHITYHGMIFRPGDEKFTPVCRIVSTAVELVVGIEHGLYAHAIASAGLELASATAIPQTHPLRQHLAMSEFNVVKLGSSAYLSGYSRIGIISDLHNLTKAGWDKLVLDLYNEYDINSVCNIPLMIAELGLDENKLRAVPILEDCLGWWNAIYSYSVEIMKDHRNDECVQTWKQMLNNLVPGIEGVDLETALALLIFNGSVFHELVGEDIKYLVRDPYNVSTRLTFDCQVSDVKTSLRTIVLYQLLSLEIPRIFTDWSKLITSASGRQKAADFFSDLNKLGHSIKEKNTIRKYPVTLLLPNNVSSSTGA